MLGILLRCAMLLSMSGLSGLCFAVAIDSMILVLLPALSLRHRLMDQVYVFVAGAVRVP